MNLEQSRVNDEDAAEPGSELTAQDLVEEWDQRVRTTVREHPFLTLFGALVGGYMVGRLVSRL